LKIEALIKKSKLRKILIRTLLLLRCIADSLPFPNILRNYTAKCGKMDLGRNADAKES